MPEKQPKNLITPTEKKLIENSGTTGGKNYTIGFLNAMRNDELTLVEVFENAMQRPGQEENHPRMVEARDFLQTHAVKFNVRLE